MNKEKNERIKLLMEDWGCSRKEAKAHIGNVEQ